ncbi:MAG: energy-coupling factor transporter transmembrane component T family protein [Candidatus Thorarchaeota archaeon]
MLPFADGQQSSRVFSPTALLISALVVAGLVSMQTSLMSVLAILTLVLLAGLVSGARWKRVLSLAARFEVLILFWMLLEPFLYGSTVILTIESPWGSLNVYSEGVYLGALLGARMFTILLIFLGVLSHMTLNDFIGALRTLRLPVTILGSMIIMLRYIPLFIEERSRMRDAQALRGYERGRRREQVRSLGNLVGTSISRSFGRSVRVYEAMSLRGFGKGMMVRGIGFRRRDLVLPVMIIILLATFPLLSHLLSEVFLL